MQNLVHILKPVLTIAVIALVMAAQFASPLTYSCQSDAKEVIASDHNEKQSDEPAPDVVTLQANDLQAIVPFVKLQLQTAYFLVRQLSVTLVDISPVPMPLPQYKDVWSEIVFCTAISSQAP